MYWKDDTICDDNVEFFAVCIMYAHHLSSYGMSSVKITGMCDPQLLAHVSSVLLFISQNWAVRFEEGPLTTLEEYRVAVDVRRNNTENISID